MIIYGDILLTIITILLFMSQCSSLGNPPTLVVNPIHLLRSDLRACVNLFHELAGEVAQ